MDHTKFINVVKQFPQVWDRNCATFRDQNVKSDAWNRVGLIVGCSGGAAKDTFKSLREKYIREREKQAMFPEKYINWQHLESLSFLDPHIILRKATQSYEEEPVKGENAPVFTSEPREIADGGDFDKSLITLVKKSSAIWDRRSNGYPSKQVKYQLWKSIAQALSKDVNVCMLRWKGLREKYIRQKSKYQEGDAKWEFLDDMSFLDKVIQYRRKNGEPDSSFREQAGPESSFPFNDYDNSLHDSSSNDFLANVKSEDFGYDHLQDSSYDSGTVASGRKRSASDNSDASFEKRHRVEDVSHKSPEVTFGELVAAMLAKKTDRDKNIAMIEIMKILTK